MKVSEDAKEAAKRIADTCGLSNIEQCPISICIEEYFTKRESAQEDVRKLVEAARNVVRPGENPCIGSMEAYAALHVALMPFRLAQQGEKEKRG